MSTSRACAHCGSNAEGGQEFCLTCGNRFERTPQTLHWLWPTLGALLVAVVGATIAVGAHVKGSQEQTVVALSPLQPAPVASVGGLVAWPRRDGYTIVLATVPARNGGSAADARARRALRASLPDVGILASSDYASLHPGYRVVFTGIFDSLDEAQAALPHVRSAFVNAYVQAITR